MIGDLVSASLLAAAARFRAALVNQELSPNERLAEMRIAQVVVHHALTIGSPYPLAGPNLLPVASFSFLSTIALDLDAAIDAVAEQLLEGEDLRVILGDIPVRLSELARTGSVSAATGRVDKVVPLRRSLAGISIVEHRA